EIPAEARLSVVPITVIADRYVQLYPAYSGGATMEDGDHIELADTSIPAELDDVLTELKGLLSALEPRREGGRGPLSSLIKNLDEALDGRSQDLAGTIEGSAAVLENLANSSSDVTKLIQNLDRTFIALANRSSQISIVNERLALVTESLLGDQANLESTIENVAFFSEEAATLLNESGDELGESFGRLGMVLRTVLKHQGALAKGIKWANVISQAAGATDANGRGLYAYTGKRAPVGTEAAQYNYRLEQRDTVACERLRVVGNTLLVILPDASPDDMMDTLLSFIPPAYHDDLAFLLRLLIPTCTNINLPDDQLLDRATRVDLKRIVDEIGTERFKELLARWYQEGYRGGGEER
ncbi:MAG TPA: MCE family protein, partial [Actinomycetota bacterium]|nr:MCE family protein [Actinomycetota bacterium]